MMNPNMTDRNPLEESLRTVQSRLRTVTAELNLAEQRERKRLAMELHDHLQQMLVLGKMKMAQGKRLAKPMCPCMKIIKQTDEILTDALEYTRTLVAELSPPPLLNEGLAAGLIWLVEYMKKHNLLVTLTMPDQLDIQLAENQEGLLFRSVRELLINSAKHAGTGRASVKVMQQTKQISIEVCDEGAGFHLAAVAGRPPHGGLSLKFGLSSIRERMTCIGGSFHIQSAPGMGTRATLTLPLGRGYNNNCGVGRQARFTLGDP